jgi:hypothetical protein
MGTLKASSPVAALKTEVPLSVLASISSIGAFE